MHQLLENSTRNGYFIWKISNFKERLNLAKEGKVTVVHSAPCFTKQYGYKYCMRIYLNGDGMGKGTHLSLFIVVIKGEYDELLTWPVVKKITFTLINLKDKKRNFVKNMHTDVNSSSFKRPSKEMNIASGMPQYIEHEQLTRGFIKDDCIYISVQIK